MEQLTCERLQDNLKRLKLVRAAEELETVAAQSEEHKSSYLSFLDHLLEEEVAAMEKRRIQTALKIAGLPFAKTIEEYDFLFNPHLDKKAVMELFDLTFLARHENVIFLGPPGVGKTHLATALAIKACSHGVRVYFTTMQTLIGKLKEPQSKGKAYHSAGLVIVDEAGYLPVDSREAYLFFQFISYRYEKSSTILTSNKSFGDPRPASPSFEGDQHQGSQLSTQRSRLQQDVFQRRRGNRVHLARVAAFHAVGWYIFTFPELVHF
jgi:DNA replication protein DnaC